MSVSGIYTTEQAKTVSTAQQTKGAAKTEYTNSVMTKVQEVETTTTTENNTQANTSKLDELKAFAANKNIKIIVFPPHSSHLVQPLED